MNDAQTQREAAIKAFLKASGWAKASRAAAAGDASSRRYERLTMGGKKAILMDAPRGAEAPAEPVGADEAARKALGYNAAARLAGPEPAAFVCIAEALTARGFSAPHILARDLEQGFLLLEDLGDDLFASVIEKNPAEEARLYAAAVDTLAAIYRFVAGMVWGRSRRRNQRARARSLERNLDAVI